MVIKNCDNCKYSGRPSYEWPCTACTSAYGSAPSKWEIGVPIPADMVEVVRCKDCKNRPCNRVCKIFKRQMNDDCFCSFGERACNG